MRIKDLYSHVTGNTAEIIAIFGQAKLVKSVDGKYQLEGGLPEDRTQAKEWISLFMHEIVLG
jgi:hypothetical protein